jgi:Tfp pilus assembly protein PilN
MLTSGSAAGVQILPDKLVFASLRKGFHDYSLKHAVVIENHRDLSVPELRNRLRQFQDPRPTGYDNLVLGLPAEEVTLRLIELPLEVEENLAQVVRFQVDRFEPSEEQRSYFDYVILSRDEDQKKILLQVAMVRQSVLDDYLNLLRDLDLYPATARLSSLGFHQLLALHENGFPKKEPVVVLGLDPGRMEIVVVLGSDRFFSEKVQINTDHLDADEVILQLYEFISRLHLKTEGVSRIFTAGRLGPELLDQLKQRFGECEALETNLNLKEKEKVAGNPDLLPAIGLAASAFAKARSLRLNLIPEEKRVIARKPSMIPTAVLAVLLLALGVTAVGREYHQSSTLAHSLDQAIQELQPKASEVMTLRQQVEAKQQELDEIRGLMKGEQQVLAVLRDLTERLPEDTYLQTLTIERGNVTLFGFSGSANALIPGLRASELYRTVQSKYTTKDIVTKKDKFNIEASLKDGEETR